jgi:predicted flap endonuclease-1-like 5' DNA nuclease
MAIKRVEGQLPAGLGKPAVRALHSNGILTLHDLARRSERDIAALHGVGPKAIRLLRAALNANGQSFRSP